MRVILRGPLGYRTRVVKEGREARGHDRPAGLKLETGVVLAVDRFLYSPTAGLVLWAAQRTRALQSGRLSAYLLYMLIALLAALSLVPILR